MIDTHTHLLPGIDDGPRDLTTSLSLARLAAADGITTVFCTPHWQAARPWPSGLLADSVKALSDAIAEAGIPLRIVPGAEVMLDPTLPALAARGALPTIGTGRYILVETPFFGIPTYMEHVLFELQLAGLKPILAHPERCEFARKNPDLVADLAGRGVLIQVNTSSVLGQDGRAARTLALRFLREGVAGLLASDAHSATTRPPLLSPCRGPLARLRQPGLFERVTETNPARLLL